MHHLSTKTYSDKDHPIQMTSEQEVQGMGIEHKITGSQFHHYPQNYTLRKQKNLMLASANDMGPGDAIWQIHQ